jgi:hypothetical protein
VELLLAMVDLQASLDQDPDRGWSPSIYQTAFDNRDGSREAVRASGPAGAAVVEAFMRLCAPLRDVVIPDGDLVHGDLSTANVLVAKGAFVGAVDVERLGSGTRGADLDRAVAGGIRVEEQRPGRRGRASPGGRSGGRAGGVPVVRDRQGVHPGEVRHRQRVWLVLSLRREALLVRVEVGDLHRCPCRSRGGEAEGSLTRVVPGRVGAALTKPGRVQHCQMGRVRRA